MVMLFCSNKDSHAADDGDYQYMSQNTDHPNYDVIQMDQREASPGRHYENAAAAERWLFNFRDHSDPKPNSTKTTACLY